MTRSVLLSIVAGLFAATAPLIAHHSEAAQFDTAKPIKITGTVKKVEWMNAHECQAAGASDNELL